MAEGQSERRDSLLPGDHQHAIFSLQEAEQEVLGGQEETRRRSVAGRAGVIDEGSAYEARHQGELHGREQTDPLRVAFGGDGEDALSREGERHGEAGAGG